MSNTLKWIVFVLKLIILIFVSSLLGLVSGLFGQIDVHIVQTLYTVLGILFSVVMSLIISFSTNDILNLEKKKEIREKISEVEKKCIIYFLIITIFFVLFDNKDVLSIKTCIISFSIYFSNIDAMILVLSIFFYILKFRYIKKNKNEIEDIISIEKR